LKSDIAINFHFPIESPQIQLSFNHQTLSSYLIFENKPADIGNRRQQELTYYHILIILVWF
jgi:hypothetical protein